MRPEHPDLPSRLRGEHTTTVGRCGFTWLFWLCVFTWLSPPTISQGIEGAIVCTTHKRAEFRVTGCPREQGWGLLGSQSLAVPLSPPGSCPLSQKQMDGGFHKGAVAPCAAVPMVSSGPLCFSSLLVFFSSQGVSTNWARAILVTLSPMSPLHQGQPFSHIRAPATGSLLGSLRDLGTGQMTLIH